MNQYHIDAMLQDTMELNELGVHLLTTTTTATTTTVHQVGKRNNNNDQEAVSALTNSLCIVKQLLINLEEEEEEEQKDHEDDVMMDMHGYEEDDEDLDLIRMVTLPYLKDSFMANEEMGDETTFIYDKVMVLNHTGAPPPSSSSSSSSGSVDVQRYSNIIKIHAGCVVYNLAMAHHRRAMVMNACLNKAKHLYNMVEKLLPSEYSNTYSTSSSSCGGSPSMTQRELDATLLLKLASLNNRAHIQYHQGCYDEAQMDLKEVAYLLNQVEEQREHQLDERVKPTTAQNTHVNTTTTTVNTSSSSSTTTTTTNIRNLIHANEWEGFVLNILLLTRPLLAAAA